MILNRAEVIPADDRRRRDAGDAPTLATLALVAVAGDDLPGAIAELRQAVDAAGRHFDGDPFPALAIARAHLLGMLDADPDVSTFAALGMLDAVRGSGWAEGAASGRHRAAARAAALR